MSRGKQPAHKSRVELVRAKSPDVAPGGDDVVERTPLLLVEPPRPRVLSALRPQRSCRRREAPAAPSRSFRCSHDEACRLADDSGSAEDVAGEPPDPPPGEDQDERPRDPTAHDGSCAAPPGHERCQQQRCAGSGGACSKRAVGLPAVSGRKAVASPSSRAYGRARLPMTMTERDEQ